MTNHKKIMIVDDDPDILLTVKYILETEGYKVFTFESGLDMLKELEKGKKPSLIILDIMMPIISGWELHRRLGENPNWKKIPVVFLTARDNDTARQMYERYGVTRIKKPFDIKEFKEKVEEVLLNRPKYSKLMCTTCYI